MYLKKVKDPINETRKEGKQTDVFGLMYTQRGTRQKFWAFLANVPSLTSSSFDYSVFIMNTAVRA